MAMSGGVDSSVAALLTQRQGLDTTGVTLKLFANEDVGIGRERTCCSLEDVEDARSVAYKLGIPYYVFNFSDSFKENVIARFADRYLCGITPNPCVDCNRFVKFGKLHHRAKELMFDYVVTGHYAETGFDRATGRRYLKKAADAAKDQSYVLYMLTQAELAATLFPLGGFTKTEVREIAEQNGFVNARKRDSQDICFVRDTSCAEFIENYTGKPSVTGRFVGADGETLGYHKGVTHYTVGQRKGLGIASEHPLYVIGLNAEKNEVRLGGEAGLYSSACDANEINLIAADKFDMPIKCAAKIRYRQTEQPATVTQTGDDRLHIEFETPQRAVTRGQAIVLYDGDYVLGGGTIC